MSWRIYPLALPPEGHPTSLGGALAHCPGAHPFWSWWLISVIHLRPVAGYPAAHLASPEMTHEIIVCAINPELCPQPDPNDWQAGYPYLTPIDVTVQVALSDDASALALLHALCTDVEAGTLSPDQDWRQVWGATIRAWCERRRSSS